MCKMNERKQAKARQDKRQMDRVGVADITKQN